MAEPAIIDNVLIEIDSKANDAGGGLEKLVAAISRLRDDVASVSPGLATFLQTLQAVSEQTKAFGDNQQNFTLSTEFFAASEAARYLALDIAEVGEQVRKVTADAREMQKTFFHSYITPTDTPPQAQQMGVDFDMKAFTDAIAKLSSVTDALNKTAEGFKSVKKAASSTENQVKRSTKRMGYYSQSFAEKFVVLVRRIIISRLIRTLVNDALNGAKEGLKDIARFSEDANKAMSALTTDTRYLRNGFAALASPILTLVMPAFDWLADHIVDITNRVAEFFAALNGSDTYTRAIKHTINYVDTLGESTEKAAKAQRQLIGGFDELNIFSKKAGADSVSSSDAEDYTKMFETVAVDAKTNEIAKKAREYLSALAPLFEGFSEVVVSIADALKGFNDAYFLPWLEALGEWAKQNPRALEIIGKGIALVVGAIVVSRMVRAATELGSIANSLAGITLAISGFAISFNGAKAIVNGDYDVMNFVKVAVGAALGLGAGLLTFGLTPAGWAIGILAALTITIGSFALASSQKAQEAFDNSEFGKEYHKVIEELEAQDTVRKQIRVDMDVALANYEDVESQWKVIEEKVAEVFELSEKKNKTAEDIERIKQDIGLIDSLTLGGVKIQFDDFAGAVTSSREEVDKLVESLKKQALTKAGEEYLTELYKKQYEAIVGQKEAQEQYGKVVEDTRPLLEEQKELLDARAEIEEQIAKLVEANPNIVYSTNKEYLSLVASADALSGKLLKNKLEYQAANDEVERAKTGLDDANNLLKDANERIQTANGYFSEMGGAVEGVKSTIGGWSDELDGFGTKIKNLFAKPFDVAINVGSTITGTVTNVVGGFINKARTMDTAVDGGGYYAVDPYTASDRDETSLASTIAGAMGNALNSIVPIITRAIEENKAEFYLGDEQVARSAANGGRDTYKQTGMNIFAYN